MGEYERHWGRRYAEGVLLCYVAFIQQILAGDMMDEVCTANDTETMSSYLQFKDWKGLHYDFALDMRLVMETDTGKSSTPEKKVLKHRVSFQDILMNMNQSDVIILNLNINLCLGWALFGIW